MTDAVLALVPAWGVWLVGLTTFLSCLALPVPASLIMLAAGGFAAVGDMALPGVAAAALVGAVAGDHAGFAIGRLGGPRLMAWLERRPRRARLVARAVAELHARGGVAVFLSRWLFSPLGPWVNFAAGATGFPWRRFALPEALGEVCWVAIYVGLGWAFAGNLEAAADLAGSVLGLLAAGAVTLGLGLWLRLLLRHGRRQPRRPRRPA